ncbi:MAG: Lrp/AsnC family transcriptional regulator [Dehalococcoidia bacterium]
MSDSLDEQLVHLLEWDARQSSEALAKQLQVSPSTVRRRIRKLMQSGILRTVAFVDPTKLGFPLIF